MDASSTIPSRRAASLQLSRTGTVRPSTVTGGVFDGLISGASTLGRRGPPVDPRYGSKRPVWSRIPLLFQLTKTDRGFGFSLSEYEVRFQLMRFYFYPLHYVIVPALQVRSLILILSYSNHAVESFRLSMLICALICPSLCKPRSYVS